MLHLNGYNKLEENKKKLKIDKGRKMSKFSLVKTLHKVTYIIFRFNKREVKEYHGTEPWMKCELKG